MARYTKAQQAEALTSLRESLQPGDTVHLILRRVSRSGMQRIITPLKMVEGGQHYLGYSAARALGLSDDGDHGVKMGGCGMDMGFALVYEMSHALWPKGYGCTGEGCRSNDHSNGDRDYTPHGTVKGHTSAAIVKATKEYKPAEPIKAEHWHRDGGYALRHRWL